MIFLIFDVFKIANEQSSTKKNHESDC